MDFDVFNGDADGLCALHQLRLAAPRDSVLVTGAKRDTRLLENLQAGMGDRLTVLDVALLANRTHLDRLLAAGADVVWFDHHHPGDIPVHPRLAATIDPRPHVCTSLLVDAHLNGQHRGWAIAAAFGDNLVETAREAACALGLSESAQAELQILGTCLNYNAYGDSVDDLRFHPAEVYRRLQPHLDPFGFIGEEPLFRALQEGLEEDLAQAEAVLPTPRGAGGRICSLPDAAWSRRIGGILVNRLATQAPDLAHALLYPTRGGYRVSVRAPLSHPYGAHGLCAEFESGGGREAAAGINCLPDAELERFQRRFEEVFPYRR